MDRAKFFRMRSTLTLSIVSMTPMGIHQNMEGNRAFAFMLYHEYPV